MAPALVLALGVAGATLSGRAAASELSWSGPVDCAEREQLLFQVEGALGASLASTGEVQLQVHVASSRPQARALLRVVAGGAESGISERWLMAPSCSSLVDTLAVAIALAIEAAAPGALDATSGVAPAHAEQHANPAGPDLLAAKGAALGADDARQLDEASQAGETGQGSASASVAERFGPIPRVAALLTGDAGSLPAAALGVALGARLDFARFQVELLGTLWLEQHTRLDSAVSAGAGGDVSLATGALSVCASLLGGAQSSFSLAPCAGLEIGRLAGAGTGVNAPRRVSALWVAPRLELAGVWRPNGSHWGFGVRAGAALPLERDEFVLDQLGSVHEPQSLVARAALSLDVALE